jgi:hypothetical protein
MKAKLFLAWIAAAVVLLASAASASAASSITDRLSASHSAIEVSSEPAGTTEVHIAVMSDLAGDGIKYLNIPVAQVSYTPVSTSPVVDVQAFGRDGAIGGWAGRLQTTPGGIEEEAAVEEPSEAIQAEASEGAPGQLQEGLGEEPLAEAGVEAATKKKSKRRREEEAQEEATATPAQMVVGVDSGGWGSSSTFGDLDKGGVHYIRTESTDTSYVEPQSLSAGVHIATVIFGTSGSIGAIAPASYAAEVKSYFARYGRDGGLAVEVLNEPGNHLFWSDPTNYAAYAKIVKAVHEALATLPAASRPAELCSWDGGEASADPDKPWGQGIKSAGALPYCDGVTVHPYGGRTGGDGGALGGRKDVELAHTESSKPVYVTEMGWPTAIGQPPTGDSQQWTEAQQASNITGFMQWAAGTGYVPMVIYFNYVDYGTNAFYGIETKARKHKLGFAALAGASARW